MSLLRRMVKARTTVEEFTNLSDRPFGNILRTGLPVGRDRALRQAAVYACIRLRAETLASLPVGPVEYVGATRRPVEPPAWLVRPNLETTRFELIERTSASIDADGNAFWFLLRDKLKRIGEVWPLPPTAVQVFRDPPPRDEPDRAMPKRFRVGNEEFGADQILHIPGFTLPGRLRGMNPIEQHAHAIGLAVAAEEFGETFFGNGAVMSGVIQLERDPGEPLVERMRSSFAQDHQGVANAHKPGVLFGAKWQQLTIPNDAAQFLETRKFQIGEIARIFRVPPHKIGDLERATFSNIEHQAIEWVSDGLVPYTARVEAAVEAGGLLDRGQRLKFNFRGLLRGDTLARYAAYAIGRQWGWLCVDDIRALEDENPLPDGKGQTYLEPLNMRPVGEQQVVTAQALVSSGVDRSIALRAVGLDPADYPELSPPVITEATV